MCYAAVQVGINLWKLQASLTPPNRKSSQSSTGYSPSASNPQLRKQTHSINYQHRLLRSLRIDCLFRTIDCICNYRTHRDLEGRILVHVRLRSFQLHSPAFLLPAAEFQHQTSHRWQNPMAAVQADGLRRCRPLLAWLHPLPGWG